MGNSVVLVDQLTFRRDLFIPRYSSTLVTSILTRTVILDGLAFAAAT